MSSNYNDSVFWSVEPITWVDSDNVAALVNIITLFPKLRPRSISLRGAIVYTHHVVKLAGLEYLSSSQQSQSAKLSHDLTRRNDRNVQQNLKTYILTNAVCESGVSLRMSWKSEDVFKKKLKMFFVNKKWVFPSAQDYFHWFILLRFLKLIQWSQNIIWGKIMKIELRWKIVFSQTWVDFVLRNKWFQRRLRIKRESCGYVDRNWSAKKIGR